MAVETWDVLARKHGGIGEHLSILIDVTIANAKTEMENKQKQFVGIVTMDRGTTSLHTIFYFDAGIPNVDEMTAAVRSHKIINLNDGEK